MPRFQVVKSNDDDRRIGAEVEDTQIAEAAKEIIKLINDPLYLMRRAIALLEGTAGPIQLDHLLD